MPAAPLFSILLTTHSDPDHLKSLLTFVRRSELKRCEVILADSSENHTWVSTLAELESNTPIRALTLPTGSSRATSLNRAFHVSVGDWIWAPFRADRANEEVLSELLRKLTKAPASVWMLDSFPPDSDGAWVESLRDGTLPLDEQWVFHRSLPADPVEPFLPNLHPFTVAELGYRTGQSKGIDRSDAFFIPERGHLSPVAPSLIEEFLFRMVRNASQPDHRHRLISSLQALEIFDRGEETESTLLTRLQALAEENPRQALDETNLTLRRNGETEELLKWKIQLLERLRRHVEAAELKHRLQHLKSVASTSDREPPRDGSAGTVVQTLPVQPSLFSEPETDTRPIEKPASPSEVHSADPAADSNPVHPRSDPESGLESAVPVSDEEEESEASPDLAKAKPRDQRSPLPDEMQLVSVIIPTTAGGRRLLEECIAHLIAGCDPEQIEVIVIDNASLDDTFDYLEQLKERELFKLQVVTNQQNLGYARAINQGLELASGSYVLLLHNDLMLGETTLDELVAHMESDNDLAAIGPSVDRCEQPEQCISHTSKLERPLLFTDAIDSCCLLLRNGLGLRLNEAYGPALFEDLDLCRQIEQRDLAIAIATRSRVRHLHRQTTEPMGLWLEPELGWRNEEIYHTRWHHRPDLDIPADGDLLERIHQAPMPVNPLNPPGYWLDQIDELFTDEARTELQNRTLDGSDLIRLCELLIVSDKRDLLRQMETRLEDQQVPLPVYLIRDLIRYYYQRNIYSRCRIYLDNPLSDGPWFDLYRLRIELQEKEIQDGPALLNRLMEHYPFHPELYRLAGEMHDIQGNDEERETFQTLARQLQPVDGETDIFEIKY